MKKTLYVFACILLVCAMPLFGAPTARPLTHIGTQIVSNPAASTALVVPAETGFAIMTIRTAGVHIAFTQAAATTTTSQYFPPGVYTWDNQAGALTNMKVINSSDGAAVVGVSYWK